MDSRRATVRARSNSVIAGAAAATGSNGGGGGSTRTRHKSGNASYADLITRAIMSSEEKRLTLSEIYDWMVDNVDGLRDQRYLHSAKGWKNAVRHTLSINPRFQKVARLGRPGWWTVDPDYLHRSTTHASSTVQQTCTPAFTTATLIWDAQASMHAVTSPGQATFRGRLSSAPALFLSPIFATANGALSASCFSPQIAVTPGSRPPSAMSIRSSGCSSTPIASPISETASSGFSVVSPAQIGAFDGNTQMVQIWQGDGGVGLMSVPRPLPIRVANVSEIGVQTDDVAVAAGPATDANAETSFPMIRNMCDYFENVSPVSSPLAVNLSSANATMEHQATQNEQNQSLDQYPDNPNVRMSLAQDGHGRPLLILTNTSTPGQLGSVYEEQPFPTPSQVYYNRDSGSKFSMDSDDGTCNRTTTKTTLEELPEDLEGIDVDPSVRCDVVAVIKYEQYLGRAPKMEPA